MERQFNNVLYCIFSQQLYRKRPGMTMLCAKLPQNVSKNRYRDISPCMDSQRLHRLSLFSSPPLSNFLCLCSLSTSASLCLPLQMMPRGSFWKAQMTTSMQITSMWVFPPGFFFLFLSFDMPVDLWVIGSLLRGLFHLALKQGKILRWHSGECTNCLDLKLIVQSLCPVNMDDGTYFATYRKQNIAKIGSVFIRFISIQLLSSFTKI